MMKLSSLVSRLAQPFKVSVESSSLAAKRRNRWAGLDALEDRKMLAADLSGATVAFTAATFTPGQTAYATITYTNSGNADAGPHTVKLYRSINNTYDAGTDTLLGATVVNTLTAGNTKSVPFSWTASASDANDEAVPDGSASLYLIAVIDEDASVTEDSDANNTGVTGSAAYTVTVPQVSVAASPTSDLAAVEGGTNSGKFVLTRTGSTVLPLTVSVTLSGTGITTSDFSGVSALSTTVTFKANSSTATYFVTPVVDDNQTATEVAGGSETLTLTVNADGTAPIDYTVGTASRNMTITDTAPTISIVGKDTLVAERASNPGTFRIYRASGDNQTFAVPVQVAFNTGTASPGIDFVASVGTTSLSIGGGTAIVTIPAKRSFVDVKITPVDDVALEATETIGLAINADPDASDQYLVGGTSTLSINLLDNDTQNLQVVVTAPTQSFTAPTTSGNQTLRFTVVITNTSVNNTVPTTVQVGLLDDADWTGGGAADFASIISLQTLSIGGLRGYQTIRKNFTIRLSSVTEVPAATYRGAAKVDSGNAITESSETDNYGYSGAVITVA